MRLARLLVRRWPGIDAAFELGERELGPGVTLIHGPNGTGKTTVARALGALLWPSSCEHGAISLEATLEEGERSWRVEREGARVRWSLGGEPTEPPPLPAEHACAMFVVQADELLAAQRTDAPFAETVRVAMSGGVDLPRMRERFTPSPQAGAVKARELTRARVELGQLERAQAALLSEATRLPELEEELAAAQAVQAEVPALEAARTLIVSRARLAELDGRRAAFPEGVAALAGVEQEALKLARAALAEEDAAARELEAREERVREDVLASRLAGPIEREVLERQRASIAKLEGSELKLEAARERRRKLEGSIEEARRSLGPNTRAERVLAITSQDLDALTELARTMEALAAQRSQLERRLAELGAQTSEPAVDLDAIARGRAALRDWLRSSGAHAAPTHGAVAWAGVAAVVVAALLLGALVHPLAFAALALALWMGWSLLRVPAAAADGEAHREAYLRSGLDEPSAWTSVAVEGRLNELEDERARASARAQAERERESLQRELARQDEGEAASRAERARLESELGIDLGASRLALDDLARRIEVLRRAHVELEGELAAERAEESRVDELADALGDFLRGHGEDPPSPESAALRASLGSLEERSALFGKARDERASVDRERRGVEERRARARGEIARLFERAQLEPDDDEGLQRLLGLREEHAELERQVFGQKTLVGEAEAQLAGHEELAALDLPGIDERMEAARAAADELERLRDERAGLQGRLDAARGDRTLERAAARVRRLEQTLEQEREGVLELTAASVLLDAIEAEHTERARPAVVKRARELFAAYTHAGFELEADARDGSLFARATGRPDRRLELEQLSSGTRVQLVLAARIAYLESAERGVRLPLVLDDALVNSDARRVVAIARSLFELVAEGRQVLVLSSEPGDEALLREAGGASAEELCVVDLAELRGEQRAERRRERLAPPELVDVPAPAGRSAEEYAAALGVAPLDPRAPLEDLDLYWLLHEDLETLRELRRRRIERFGHYVKVSEGGAELGLTPADHERVRRSGRLARLVLETWRIGRGRKLSAAAVLACPAISSNFQEQFEELAASVGWNATRLFEGLRSGELKLKRFHARKLDEAEAWMHAEGHLSPETPLEREQARRNVELALGDGEGFEPLDLHRRIDFLWARCEEAE